MNTLEKSLDPEMFQRIHRSAIVNVRRIKELARLTRRISDHARERRAAAIGADLSREVEGAGGESALTHADVATRRRFVKPIGHLVKIPFSKSTQESKLGFMKNDCLAELSGVSKRFGKIVALDGLDLEVQRGELLAVLGPNGAGKTTAISLLLGLRQPDAGTARLFGQSPLRVQVRRQVGVMMQEVTLAPETPRSGAH